MASSPLTELPTEQLRDLYDAEKQLTKALPRLAKASADAELKDSFTKHAVETQEQVRRIEEIFAQMGFKARGKPSCVRGTGKKGDIGLTRIEFPGKPNAKDNNLQEITWEEFFEKFNERGLALVYQTKTAAGKKSNFNKVIAREGTGR